MRKRTKLLLVIPLLLPLITQPHIQALSSPSDTVAPFLVTQKPSFPDMTENFHVTVEEPARIAAEAEAERTRLEAEEAARQALEAARQAEIQRQAYLNTVAGRVQPYGTYWNSYTPLNCTYYVASRILLPSNLGNANNWGYALGAHSQPLIGSIAWTTAGWAGHVAIVTAIDGNSVQVAEENVFGLGVIDSRWTSSWDWSGYIY